MEPSFFLQEPGAPSSGLEGSQSAPPSNAPAAFSLRHTKAPGILTGQLPPAQFLPGEPSQAFPNPELQYGGQGQNVVSELFQEDPYGAYAVAGAHMVGRAAQTEDVVQAAIGQVSRDFKQPDPEADFETRVKSAEKKLKDLDASLTKVQREKAALEKELAKEKKDRAHFQEFDAKRAQEREAVAAWETHWRTQEKQLKVAVEESRQKNQAMQAKLGALEARLQGAFEEIEKLRSAVVAANERASKLEGELEEERQAYRELEDEKAADREMIAEGTAAGKDWSKEAVRLRKELEGERKARGMWQSMTAQLAKDLNDEKARRMKEVSTLRGEYARGANGEWLVRIEELEAEMKKAREEAGVMHTADQTRLNEVLTELAAEKRQKQSWQQIAERIGKESKEGKKEVEIIQRRLQEALKSSKLLAPQGPPQVSAHAAASRRGCRSSTPERGGSQPLASSLENHGGQESKPQAETKESDDNDDEATDDEAAKGGDKRAARVPPRKRLKSLADLGGEGPKKVWKSRRPRGSKQGNEASAARLAQEQGGEEPLEQEEAQPLTTQALEA